MSFSTRSFRGVKFAPSVCVGAVCAATVLAACALSFAPLWAQLELGCVVDGRTLPVAMAEEHRLWLKDGDALVPALPDAKWNLEGDLRDSVLLLEWSHPAHDVIVDFVVNTDGRVLFPRVRYAADPRLLVAVVEALSHRQFAPPVSAGRPVAAHAQIPVQFQSSTDRASRFFGVNERPVAVHQVWPEYPAGGGRFRPMARVTVQFIVSVKGRPENIRIVETSGPAFSVAAINAISQWTFQPAKLLGQPIASQLEQLFIFDPAEQVAGLDQSHPLTSGRRMEMADCAPGHVMR